MYQDDQSLLSSLARISSCISVSWGNAARQEEPTALKGILIRCSAEVKVPS